MLFDNGGRSAAHKSTGKALSAQEREYEFAKKQTLLQVRQAYFSVQQLLQRLVLLNGQLEVTQKQLADVQAAYQAGVKSKLDVSVAKKQVLQTRTSMSAARGALSAQLRALFKLTGTDYDINPVYPTDKRLASVKLDGTTSAVLDTDTLENTLTAFVPYATDEFDENSPKLAALDDMAQYYEYLADSYQASLYPRVALQGGAYWEYPNGALREHVFLGRAGAALSLPLFEGGKDRRQAQAERERARAAGFDKQDAQETLEKLFYSAKDRLYALQVQETLGRQTILEAQETARLTYQAYQAGSVTFFEVDKANLTLLRLIRGLLRPSSGKISFTQKGRPCPAEQAHQQTGYFPQEPSLYPDLSVWEHLEFFRDLYNVPAAEFERRAQDLLQATEMTPFKDRPAGKLSGGMYKKLGLMCVLLNRPALLLLDEPTIGVDPVSRQELWDLVYQVAGPEMTVILSTSYMDEAERCAKVHILQDGHLLHSGSPEEIMKEKQVKQFADLFV